MKYLHFLFSILFFFSLFGKTNAQQVVLNGAKTTPINFPAGSCVYHWTNNNTSIGLAASGTGNIPSFTAVNTGRSPVTATITGTPVGTVGFAYIVNAGSNNVSVINIATSAVVATIPVGSNPNAVAVDPNYNEVYIVNNSSNTVSVISTLTNTVTATIPVGPTPWSVTVSRDGSRAYVADGGDNEVEVINTTTNTVIATIPAGNNPNALAVSPDGSLIYVNNANSVLVINTATQAVVATIPIGSAPQAILITPDGSKVYEANYGSNNVYAINTATNTVAAIIPVGVNPGGGSMSPDGSLVYIANENSNTVSVISTATNTVVKTIPVGASPWGVSVRPDGTQIYVANSGSNTVSVVNASTNAIVATIPVGASPYSFGNFFTAGSNCTELVKFTITVNPAQAAQPTITADTVSGTISACAGTVSVSPNIQQFTVSGSSLTGNITATAPTGFELSLAAGSGYSNTLTLTQTGGTVSNTIIYVRSAASLPGGTTTASVVLSSAGATSQSVSVTATINPVVSPSLTISASANNICAGTPVTFTATATDGGSAPVYKWLLNGNNAGTNSPTFSSSTLVNGDVVSCVMTSNAACVTPASATSNSITMIVSTQVVPAVSISTPANGVCAGTPVTFTATPTNGGSSPVYQWMVNGADAGTNSSTFSSNTFANGDVVSCVMTSSSTCATPANITSNSIVLNILPLPVVNGGGNKTIEKGNSVALTATASANVTGITWSPSAGLDNNKILNPQASPASTTLYTITVQTAAGCMAIDSVTVTVSDGITIPNIFTPNGDGKNDVFEITGLENYPGSELFIINRWGNEVYHAGNYLNNWDGSNLAEGTYYYILNLKQPTGSLTTYKGWVYLKRTK